MHYSEKESTGFSPGFQKCPWHLATLYSQYPEKHLGRTEDGKFRGSALHTHTILDPHWHRGLLPWNQSPCQLLAAWFSERLQEWKLLLTRSITPLRLSQRNTIYYQHVFSSRRCLEKVSLYEYFKKADHKIRETWYLGFFFFFPFDEENSGFLLSWAIYCICYLTCIYSLRRKMS